MRLLWSPGSHPDRLRWRWQGLPGSWETPVHARPALRPRWDLRAKPIAAPRCCLGSLNSLGSHELWAFGALSRGPHARCLRFAGRGYPLPTQDSLPAGGQPLPGGIGYPPGFIEDFTSRHDDPNLPGFPWRNHGPQATDSPELKLAPRPQGPAWSRYHPGECRRHHRLHQRLRSRWP